MRDDAIFDLAVIGSGPGGASAAITAARANARVILFEKGTLPRQRVCGEFVSSESLTLLSGLLRPKDRSLLSGAVHIANARIFIDDREVALPVHPPAASIARFDLDLALWNSAREAGVCGSNTLVQRISGTGPFELTTSDQTYSARAVVNASGRWSNLNARTALPSAEKFIGIKAHFAEPDPHPSVDLYFFDGGYCGVQPVDLAGTRKDNRVNASAMVRADVGTSLAEVFARHPRLRLRSDTWQRLCPEVTTSPLIFGRPRPVSGSVLSVGDAAAFVDPFVGDGISLALRSGALAAHSLVEFFVNKITLAQAAVNYSHAYNEKLAPVFRASSRVRRLVRLPHPVRASLVYALSKAPSVGRWMVRNTR
jgi:flavin-dependent dehydrogenase